MSKQQYNVETISTHKNFMGAGFDLDLIITSACGYDFQYSVVLKDSEYRSVDYFRSYGTFMPARALWKHLIEREMECNSVDDVIRITYEFVNAHRERAAQ